MPFAVFFDAANGDAFHEGDVKAPSHGCIHLSHEDAHWLFDWVAKDPVEVSVEGEYPKTTTFPHV